MFNFVLRVETYVASMSFRRKISWWRKWFGVCYLKRKATMGVLSRGKSLLQLLLKEIIGRGIYLLTLLTKLGQSCPAFLGTKCASFSAFVLLQIRAELLLHNNVRKLLLFCSFRAHHIQIHNSFFNLQFLIIVYFNCFGGYVFDLLLLYHVFMNQFKWFSTN